MNISSDGPEDPGAIPVSTGGPFLMAFGVTLLFAGMVTNPIVYLVGAVCSLVGGVIWWFGVLPGEQLERIDQVDESPVVPVASQSSTPPKRRMVPEEIHPYRSGIGGGLAGGVAMALVALGWGLIAKGSLWMPVNLLAGALLPQLAGETPEQLATFQVDAFIAAICIHIAMSIMIGLLYAACLPMMPRHPVIFGGLLAPVLWSGLLYAAMSVINPALEQMINWWWFLGSQFAFGIVAGWVISRSEMVPTMQFMDLKARMELERGKDPSS